MTPPGKRASRSAVAFPPELLDSVYGELREVAARYLRRERRNHTLQPTALVHEAYLKLIRQAVQQCPDQTHFVAIAARAMRQVLVDHERGHRTQRRGGEVAKVSLGPDIDTPVSSSFDLLTLEDALVRLEAIDPQLSRVVELRLFAGLRVEEIAKVLGISSPTVKRSWRLAK